MLFSVDGELGESNRIGLDWTGLGRGSGMNDPISCLLFPFVSLWDGRGLLFFFFSFVSSLAVHILYILEREKKKIVAGKSSAVLRGGGDKS